MIQERLQDKLDPFPNDKSRSQMREWLRVIDFKDESESAEFIQTQLEAIGLELKDINGMSDSMFWQILSENPTLSKRTRVLLVTHMSDSDVIIGDSLQVISPLATGEGAKFWTRAILASIVLTVLPISFIVIADQIAQERPDIRVHFRTLYLIYAIKKLNRRYCS